MATGRPDDLTASTLDQAFAVAASVFHPAVLALRLKERLRELIDSAAVTGAVMDVPLANGHVCPASAVWVFVSEETYAQLRTCPPAELDIWLVDRVLVPGGVLSRDEIARANAREGLHMLMLYFRADESRLDEAGRMSVVQEMMSHIFPQMMGYNLRSVTARVRHRSQVASAIQAGMRLVRPDLALPACDGDFLPTTVLMSIERESVEFAAWVAGLFVWQRPRFGFTAAEQRTLALAVRGHRDVEIADACRVSASTVKKRWDSIFARVAAIAPEMFDGAGMPGRRGPEKRSTLLAYLADHPEELRPYEP